MISLIKKLWGMEIIRYLFAGGTAFVFDNILVFNLFNMFLLPDLGVWMGMSVTNMVSVTMGFIVGLLINNLLSLFVVFTSEEQKKNSRTVKAFIEFTVVGIIGLILSIGLNQACIGLFGSGKTLEMIYKISIAIPVTGWNYIGRKFFANKK